VRRYDVEEGDSSPIDAAEFVEPNGMFVVVHDDGVPIGMGGWRRYGTDGVGEIKRMYVQESARGRGISRLLLAHLERTAVDAGISRLVLETGLAQPEAIALYRSSGYVDVEPFGHYVEYADSVHLGKTL
jgi:GNAT superfamily N-acetyltransferase